MTGERNVEVQQLRTFIATKKRSIEAAEKRYDISAAVIELRELAAPLHSAARFPSTWKGLYLECCYREVATFVLDYVAVHIEDCLSEIDREQVFDVFFNPKVVPSSRAIGALTCTLSMTKTRADVKDEMVRGDAEASIAQCVRLLERAIAVNGVEDVVTEMLRQEQQPMTGGEKNTIGRQVLVSQLSSLPDLIFNRCQRNVPTTFHPRRYFPTLCDGLFHSLSMQEPSIDQSRTFRMFADKLVRIGQAQALIQSWLRFVGTSSTTNVNHALLFQSLPESCYEKILVEIAGEKLPHSMNAQQALSLPKYRLLAQVPRALCANKQFEYVVAHKLLLRKAIDDFFFWRILVDVLAQCGSDPCNSPLAAVFDVVLARWSQSDFAVNTEYTVNASVCFFLRYSLIKFTEGSEEAAFAQRDWITKICKGVQDHMSHSLGKIRALGMRVGESLSRIIASEKPLDFGLEDDDPLTIYGCPVLPQELEKDVARLELNASSAQEELHGTSSNKGNQSRSKRSRKRSSKPFTLDPDELVLSDDDDASDGDGESVASSDGADSDSDMSLEAYDLHDDEEDLTVKRPLYLKDLIAGLLSDSDREVTEAALNEAEVLLRRQPRDLKDKAHEVVRALLRLEDKYNTPSFTKLRSQALTTACAMAPTQTLPYLCSQVLEREQLLQSRIDVLQAMTSAAQELSERGGSYQRLPLPRTLVQEKDIGTRTMQSLKTRRWGYRRDPLAAPKANAFAPYALDFFSPLLFGYVDYVRKHSAGSGTSKWSRSEVEQTFLAHLLHALASFVECSGQAPQTMAMAKCLLEFVWSERANTNAEVRRQVLFSLSRVLLVTPPALLRQEAGETLAHVVPWLRQVQNNDPDGGCREAAQLLNSSLPLI